jgi:hypothetical protein
MASNEIEVLDPAATVEKVKNLASGRALNRRHFMAALGMTGAAATVAGCSSTTSSSATTATGFTSTGQTDVLNFALNLEYLEATFYSWITQGSDLPSSLIVGSGTVTNAPVKLTFATQQITDLLNEIYYDELSHVMALTSLLGPTAVARPAINLAAAGAVTASTALGIARAFEDVGVTAYSGAAASLTDSNLTFAAQILGVESFHSGALRLLSIQNPSIAPYVPANSYSDTYDVPPKDVGNGLQAGNPAANGPTASGGFFPTAYASNASTAIASGGTTGAAAGAGNVGAITPSGFAFARTTSQVLSIVYGGGGKGTTSGGFFPNGVNGNINTV